MVIKHLFSRREPLVLLLALGVALCAVQRAGARDDVAIPKSRLEELLRKEAELEKLKAQPQTNVAPANPSLPQAAPAMATPVVTHVSPPITSLPPLATGDVVDALDLANYYSADAASADRRFLKRKLKLKGEIAGFDKTLFARDYKVILKTVDPKLRIVCDVVTPEQYSASFTTKEGTEVVGSVGENRFPIARVGDRVILSGTCKGLSGTSVRLSSCSLSVVR